nr:uncharacterized protein LOC109622483 [Aedes albopictus]
MTISRDCKWIMTPTMKQIAISSNVISAHRGQIKVVKNSEPRRNVALQEVAARARISSKRRFESSDEDEPFQSTSSRQVLHPPTPPPPVRSEVHPTVLQSYDETQATHNDKRTPRIISPQSSEQFEVRRSKRFKKKKIDSDFVYTK